MATYLQVGRDTLLAHNIRKISVQPQGDGVYALRINNSYPSLEGSKELCNAVRENILDQLRGDVQIVVLDMGEDLPEEDALWGLLHDAGEAYISDLPKPFKDGIMEVYGPHEERILEVVASKFGLEMPYSEEVKWADWALLVLERDQVISNQDHIWESVTVYEDLHGRESLPDLTINCWSPQEARERFLERFYELTTA